MGAGWEYRRNSFGHQNWFGQSHRKDRRPMALIGVQYTLPWLIVADAGIDHTRHVRLEISRDDIPLSPRLRAGFMVNSDKPKNLKQDNKKVMHFAYI